MKQHCVAVLALTLLLAACGGTTTPPTQAPTPPTTPAPVTPTPPTTPTPTPDDPNDDLEVTEFVTVEGDTSGRAIGIIRNQSTSNVRFVQLTVNYYNTQDQLVATETTYSELEIIAPGEASPFRFLFIDFPDDADEFELVYEWDRTDEQPIRGLTVNQVSLDKDRFSTNLIGEVTNTSALNLEFVEAIYSCRNSAGELVDAGSNYVEADVLAPGTSSTFDAYLFADDTDSCEATAEGSVVN